ncbi:glycoside hydrolase family 2 TIM barrel-domain containing protein [Cerasicoccus frondis]|uniref:glycoside hydrolase family 2 TIM barrel-domain containing protein n=1 Tax=Cerasicoccus frondis TaxID=490090 RepID=UPI002852CB3C|nr:glycoside hydrolase family 2 TIM barrel-domain containing protein [Cerasicoccus frondis]
MEKEIDREAAPEAGVVSPKGIAGNRRVELDKDWAFSMDGQEFSEISLPHTPQLCDLNGTDMWTGICFYERDLLVENLDGVGSALLRFEGLMQQAEIWLDGQLVGTHSGGYLPACIDIRERLVAGQKHRLAVRLDNRHNPEFPPGKQLDQLDFCWHGGLYRSVSLELKPHLHITDEAEAQVVAGGGIFVQFPRVTDEIADISVSVGVRNGYETSARGEMRVELIDTESNVVSSAKREFQVQSVEDAQVTVTLQVEKPKLWFPDDPILYRLRVVVEDESNITDTKECHIGIRRFQASRSNGLEINGKHYRLRGTNRHQEYPYIGYALSDAAQWRDALKIKNSGFDYVRCAHYSQSPAFLDACDALGIIVMNCIPGWQFFGGQEFQAACETAGRELIRRDRNHACVFFWELSLNETEMTDEFMERMQRAGHEEFPGDQFYTCGWIDAFDIYIRSRQHDGLHTYENGERALIIAEYGDWEFHASNAGFDQHNQWGLMDPIYSSRHFRGNGERALLQQADNFGEALNENMTTRAIACGQWAFCDYTRGNNPERAAMGVRDIFRLPKYAHYLYRSQRGISSVDKPWDCGAMVFIASQWSELSSPRVTVYSNAERVELFLNGKSVGIKEPSISYHTQHLPQAPFIFDLGKFTPGRLEAHAMVGEAVVARDIKQTAGNVAGLRIVPSLEGIVVSTLNTDTILLHVECVDDKGFMCTEFEGPVTVEVSGPAQVASPSQLHLEAGIASTVLRTLPKPGDIVVTARSGDLLESTFALERTHLSALPEIVSVS